ncbi:DMT family transporter [Noviherbaspirillum cavernae]|uniref:DMT family transporter n=1 Tax=Noviherbaspirillum cavernae TaxID=2320862 RepID=A0A418X324_9BURK|nr:DMT family transporter [Noviherbaspirillum cavernae]RJG06856.1 DMT family transporter [Noviherbaspirillum cavernae]
MKTWYVMLAIAAGAVLPIQVGVNSTLRHGIGSPIVAALISFGVGTVCLLAYALAARAEWPTAQMLAKLPMWAWIGGVVGAFYVATAILVAPKLGAANLVCLTIAAQLFMSLLLDHYGLIGFAQHGINVARIVGALLLIAGTVMIVKY